MELIDRNVLIDAIQRYANEPIKLNDRRWDTKCVAIIMDMIGTVKSQPTIEAEPVKHGRWIKIRTIIGRVYTGCSICHAPIPMDCQLDSIGEDDCHYCYDCGARMDGEAE